MTDTSLNPELRAEPHRRFNALTGEWILVSPQRTQRPWQGQQEEPAGGGEPEYDAHCYLCPGNARSGGQRNPDYTDTFVFDNDFPALLPEAAAWEIEEDALFRVESERGVCRVMCFSPRHDLSVARLGLPAVRRVVEGWKEQYRELGRNPDIAYVQIFENKGEIMGCSNPHPHCQIWASSSIPTLVEREGLRQTEYLEQHGRPLLVDYLEREREQGVRMLYENAHFAVVVPFWATWPFETLVLPRRHRPSLAALEAGETEGLADAYRVLARSYNAVFDCEFPYTAGFHQAPVTAGDHAAWQMHMHFYPPLLRSATIRKFMVGYEMLASPQRDITAEAAAETLRQALQRSGN